MFKNYKNIIFMLFFTLCLVLGSFICLPKTTATADVVIEDGQQSYTLFEEQKSLSEQIQGNILKIRYDKTEGVYYFKYSIYLEYEVQPDKVADAIESRMLNNDIQSVCFETDATVGGLNLYYDDYYERTFKIYTLNKSINVTFDYIAMTGANANIKLAIIDSNVTVKSSISLRDILIQNSNVNILDKYTSLNSAKLHIRDNSNFTAENGNSLYFSNMYIHNSTVSNVNIITAQEMVNSSVSNITNINCSYLENSEINAKNLDVKKYSTFIGENKFNVENCDITEHTTGFDFALKTGSKIQHLNTNSIYLFGQCEIEKITLGINCFVDVSNLTSFKINNIHLTEGFKSGANKYTSWLNDRSVVLGCSDLSLFNFSGGFMRKVGDNLENAACLEADTANNCIKYKINYSVIQLKDRFYPHLEEFYSLDGTNVLSKTYNNGFISGEVFEDNKDIYIDENAFNYWQVSDGKTTNDLSKEDCNLTHRLFISHYTPKTRTVTFHYNSTTFTQEITVENLKIDLLNYFVENDLSFFECYQLELGGEYIYPIDDGDFSADQEVILDIKYFTATEINVYLRYIVYGSVDVIFKIGDFSKTVSVPYAEKVSPIDLSLFSDRTFELNKFLYWKREGEETEYDWSNPHHPYKGLVFVAECIEKHEIKFLITQDKVKSYWMWEDEVMVRPPDSDFDEFLNEDERLLGWKYLNDQFVDYDWENAGYPIKGLFFKAHIERRLPLRYVVNGESWKVVKYWQSDEVIASIHIPEVADYTFVEWYYIDNNDEEHTYYDGLWSGANLNIFTGTRELYARFEATKYKITYENNLPADAYGAENLHVNSNYEYTTIEKYPTHDTYFYPMLSGTLPTNYTFLGWSDKPDGEVLSKLIFTEENFRNAIFYAVWQEITEMEVCLMLSDETTTIDSTNIDSAFVLNENTATATFIKTGELTLPNMYSLKTDTNLVIEGYYVGDVLLPNKADFNTLINYARDAKITVTPKFMEFPFAINSLELESSKKDYNFIENSLSFTADITNYENVKTFVYLKQQENYTYLLETSNLTETLSSLQYDFLSKYGSYTLAFKTAFGEVESNPDINTGFENSYASEIIEKEFSFDVIRITKPKLKTSAYTFNSQTIDVLGENFENIIFGSELEKQYISFGGITQARNVDAYSLEVNFNKNGLDATFGWLNGSSSKMYLTWRISAYLIRPATNTFTLTYNGEEQNILDRLSFSDTDLKYLKFTGATKGTDATTEDYVLTVSIIEDLNNVKWIGTNGADTTITWKIDKKKISIDLSRLKDVSYSISSNNTISINLTPTDLKFNNSYQPITFKSPWIDSYIEWNWFNCFTEDNYDKTNKQITISNKEIGTYSYSIKSDNITFVKQFQTNTIYSEIIINYKIKKSSVYIYYNSISRNIVKAYNGEEQTQIFKISDYVDWQATEDSYYYEPWVNDYVKSLPDITLKRTEVGSENESFIDTNTNIQFYCSLQIEKIHLTTLNGHFEKTVLYNGNEQTFEVPFTDVFSLEDSSMLQSVDYKLFKTQQGNLDPANFVDKKFVIKATNAGRYILDNIDVSNENYYLSGSSVDIVLEIKPVQYALSDSYLDTNINIDWSEFNPDYKTIFAVEKEYSALDFKDVISKNGEFGVITDTEAIEISQNKITGIKANDEIVLTLSVSSSAGNNAVWTSYNNQITINFNKVIVEVPYFDVWSVFDNYNTFYFNNTQIDVIEELKQDSNFDDFYTNYQDLFSGDFKQKDVGNYNIKISLPDVDNFEWSNYSNLRYDQQDNTINLDWNIEPFAIYVNLNYQVSKSGLATGTLTLNSFTTSNLNFEDLFGSDYILTIKYSLNENATDDEFTYEIPSFTVSENNPVNVYYKYFVTDKQGNVVDEIECNSNGVVSLPITYPTEYLEGGLDIISIIIVVVGVAIIGGVISIIVVKAKKKKIKKS